MKKWWWFGCLIWLLLLPVSLFAADNNTQRRAFLLALSALQRNNQPQFVAIAKHLQHYSLYPYLIYADLALHLPQATPAQLQGFLTTYQNTPLAAHLRELWLNQLAEQEKWNTYLQVYQPSKNLNLVCAQRKALWKTGKTTEALNHLTDVLDKNMLPKNCLWILGQAAASGSPLGQHLLWNRIQHALENNDMALASQLSLFLPASQKNTYTLWREIAENPFLILNTHLFNATQELSDNILLTAIQKLSRKNPRLAAEIWTRIAKQISFAAPTQSEVLKTIALGLAQAHDTAASAWLAAVPENMQDEAVQEWRIRDALWQQNWQVVVQAIQSLPQKDRQQNIWRYWFARALTAQGRAREAKNIYYDLSLHGDFYGQLANLQLQQPPLVYMSALKVTPSQIAAVAALPALQRARELYQLHWLPEAGQEWQWAVTHLPEEDYLAAAELAIHWGWFERAIATVNLINDGAHIPVRFPLAYREPILAAAQKNSLNPAWLFALIRQESLFTPYAKSSAGAVGLMQVLPSTASDIAHKMHLDLSPDSLTEVGTNVYLGSIFLKEAALKFKGNEVLATAAYNAGPNRVKRWLPPRGIAADIWIENIPYQETRTYVKNIMTFMTFYEKELGLPFSLANRVKPL